MERLTTNKSVAEMSMIELAHNSCYADDERNARYRDYNLDVDSRWLIRNLVKDICGEDFKDLSDEEVDEYMASMLSVEIDSTIGLLALFYRNLWAMADLREKLKYYEDADEQGLLLWLPAPLNGVESFNLDGKTTWYRLPCRIGDTVYMIDGATLKGHDWKYLTYEKAYVRETIFSIEHINSFGKTVFLTREEAEAKLKEMEEKDGR